MPKIAVFAGHGGSDNGAVGVGGLREKDLNLAVSNAVSSILRGWGYHVFNNRTTDVDRYIPADAAYANDNRVDALVELHLNSNEGVPASGSEMFYSIRDTGMGRVLASSILRRLVALGFRDRGIKTQLNASGQDAFAILRLSNMPAVLVESAFINNPEDMAKFDVAQVARAIAEGIREVFPISGGGLPAYPGTPLRQGSSGDAVRQIQGCLNTVSTRHPSIPRLAADGLFGSATHGAVVAFQRIFGLTQDGVVGPVTWERIMSECAAGTAPAIPPFPGTSLRMGSSGDAVRQVQSCLNAAANRNPSIPRLVVDGLFGSATHGAVLAFQRIFGLAQDGIVGPATWERLMTECGSGITAALEEDSGCVACIEPEAEIEEIETV